MEMNQVADILKILIGKLIKASPFPWKQALLKLELHYVLASKHAPGIVARHTRGAGSQPMNPQQYEMPT